MKIVRRMHYRYSILKNSVVCNNVYAPLASIMYSFWRTLIVCYMYLCGRLHLNYFEMTQNS